MWSEMCSLTTWQEALAIMGQSLEKDSVKYFSLIGSKCSYRGYLLIVCTPLAVPKTAPIKRKTSKIRRNSYRMSARGAWIGTTSARGNVNSKRRQPRGVYIPRAEVIPIHAPRARIR